MTSRQACETLTGVFPVEPDAKEPRSIHSVGACVRLKSGGPEMVIEDIRDVHGIGRDYAVCVWFDDGGSRHEAAFVPEGLVEWSKAA